MNSTIPVVLGTDPFRVVAYRNEPVGVGGMNEQESYFIQTTYTGLKWECVEYVRRWHVLVRGVTFPSIPIALDIWEIRFVYSLHPTKKEYRWQSIPHIGGSMPMVGDTLVYEPSVDNPHGHVAMVVGVNDSLVYLAEQNYDTQPWNHSYSRVIHITNEPHLKGWKRILTE
jgi:glutathionylspermidine amidase/synthetase